MVKLHGEHALAARDGTQIGSVAQDFIHGHMRLDFGDAALRVRAEHLAATRGEVADDIAHVFVRNGYGEQNDGFKQYGLQGFEGLFESQRTGDLERHFRGIHSVVAAVVQADLEVHHRASGKEAASRGFLNALVDGGDVVARNRSAHDGVLEHIAGTARQTFHFDPAVAELTATAALLLVPALHLHLAAYRFTIGNLGGLE